MAEAASIGCVGRRDNGRTSPTVAKPPPVVVPNDADDPLNSSQTADGSGSEEEFFEEDDPHSFIEPAMSPAVTRLTSPKTPAAEKAAAMGQAIRGYFDGAIGSRDDDSSGEETPTQQEPTQEDGPEKPSMGTKMPLTTSIPPPQPQPEPVERLPTPWRTGPKEIIVTSSNSQASRPNMVGLVASAGHRRSSSAGAEALRRLSRALPSISLPYSFMPNILQTSFFSSSSATPKSDSKGPTPETSPRTQSPPSSTSPEHSSTLPMGLSPQKPRPAQHDPQGSGSLVRPPSAMSRRSVALRRSTSDESLLYHSLSRMSSFGDDQRFTRVREQVNSRFKAIVDSFDPPSFKLPSIPSNLSLRSPLKKTEFTIEETVQDPTRSSALRAARFPKDPLDTALDALTGDLVIMGGYRGSVLRSAEPPHRQLWVPIKVGLNVRKVNLEVGLDPEDEENMEETIIPSGMLKNIGPIDISKKLFKRLRECENVRTGKLRVHDYGYDWRLSPHRLSKQLLDFMRTLPSNQGEKPSGAFVIAHSLGGVITRHAVNQAPELFSGVVYAGSPQRCINILGPLRNGDAVLLNEKVLTAHVNFSLRTTFVFLPEDGFCFIDKVTGEEYNIDFFNPDEWVKHRLCPSVGGPALPPFSKRTGSRGSFLSLPDSLSLNRGRSSSDASTQKPAPSPQRKLIKDRALAPQMDASSAATQNDEQNYSPHHQHQHHQQQQQRGPIDTTQERNLAYLTRTLAEIKRFRTEIQHSPTHQSANAYPPIAVIYGKEIPTVYASRVTCREAIACADAYDDLAFGSGDGVVLARQAMPPPGYEIVRGGRVSTDKGHISILGDFNAVGRAVMSVVRGREKGIGLGSEAKNGKVGVPE